MADVLDITGKVVRMNVTCITPQEVLKEIQSIIDEGRKITRFVCVFMEEKDGDIFYLTRSSDMNINEAHMLHSIGARMKIDLCLGEDDEE